MQVSILDTTKAMFNANCEGIWEDCHRATAASAEYYTIDGTLVQRLDSTSTSPGPTYDPDAEQDLLSRAYQAKDYTPRLNLGKLDPDTPIRRVVERQALFDRISYVEFKLYDWNGYVLHAATVTMGRPGKPSQFIWDDLSGVSGEV